MNTQPPNMELLLALYKWQSEGKRHFKIERGMYSHPNHEEVFIYDYDIMAGTTIKTVEELDNIDLKAVYKERLRQALEEA